MTAQQLQKRTARAEGLKVLQADDMKHFFVESNEGKILYRVTSPDGESLTCTCGDFAANIKRDPNHQCKHIAAVLACQSNGGPDMASFLERAKPKLDDRFVMTIDGKDFVKYPGLLDLGHQKGISKIEVEVLQLPGKDNGNFAICRATVVSRTGETFIDIGDASPENVNSRIAKHLLRMASTRAIARALRSYTNIGMTCLEELEGLDDIREPSPEKPTRKASVPKAQPRKAVKEPKQESTKAAVAEEERIEQTSSPAAPKTTQPASQQTKAAMSEAQKRAIHNLSRRRGISLEELESMSEEAYGVGLEFLTALDASSFIRQLQTAA